MDTALYVLTNQEQDRREFDLYKARMLPFGYLVCPNSKMSEARRSSQRLATDFSIARILAADQPDSSSSSASEGRVPSLPDGSSCPCCPSNSLAPDNLELPIEPDNLERTEGRRLLKESRGDEHEAEDLPWLHCTRYRPPRLPKRSSAGKTSKRRPGKHPRIPFTAFQLQILEDKYSKGAYLARRDVVQLSLILRLPQSRVKIWFQNRRARERRESLQSGINQAPNSPKNVNKSQL